MGLLIGLRMINVCVKINLKTCRNMFIRFTGLTPKSFGLEKKKNLCFMCSLLTTKVRKVWIMEHILSICLVMIFN